MCNLKNTSPFKIIPIVIIEIYEPSEKFQIIVLTL